MVPPDLNLTPLHVGLSIIGGLIALYAMQLAARDMIGRGENSCVRWLRRAGYCLTGAGMWWAASYGLEQGWQPWPPNVAILFGVDMIMAASVFGGHLMRDA